MKKIVFFIVLALLIAGASLTSVSQTNGSALVTMQNAWTIVDSENSGDTQATALALSELKKLRLDIAIAAASSGDENISTFSIPSKWNGVRFRSANITIDNGNVVYDLYLGSLGGGIECDLVYVGQLSFTSGKQLSSYYQIAFTGGGTYVPKIGDTVTGNDSGETAVIVSISALTGGAWVDSDAAGTVTYRSSTGTFTSPETVTIKRANRILSTDAYTHASSDLVAFYWADTLTVTAKSWGSSWSSVSPADDTIAEAELDVKGADFLVILPSTCDADAKLLIKGY